MDPEKLEAALACLRITRRDTTDFIKKLLAEPHPFQALTARDIGRLIPTRSGKGQDRETARKLVARPLVDVGILERVTRERDGSVVLGHPRARSPYCAYRLTRPFWETAQAGFGEAALQGFLGRNREAQARAQAHAVAASCLESPSETLHERLLDACLNHFRRIHLGAGFRCIYRDPVEGPRMTPELVLSLGAAGLALDTLHDPYPDLVFWNEQSGSLCLVEGVTSEGAIDARRLAVLKSWVRRCVRKRGRGAAVPKTTFVTAFVSWKAAAAFLGTVNRGTAVWVQDSPHTLVKVCGGAKNFFGKKSKPQHESTQLDV
jgi:hypothetical protein